MNLQTLLFETNERIATVTINRPDKLNALNAQAKSELREVFSQIKTDSSVDVVILTGAGEKAFVAGTDIKELTVLNSETGKEFSAKGQEVFDLIENLGKPVIAAVNGYALGGGCELALACHIRIASENAKFGQPEVNLGVIPGYGGTQRLARLIGRGRAMELILTGNQMDAQEALRVGLVNKIVPQADLMSAALTMAELIASKGQIAIRMALKAVNMTQETMLNDGQKLEASLFGVCCDSEDFKEGTAAFLEKRKPVFKKK
ncbi:MAG: enoyl-CoA hydratase/isomerase family protein [Bacteroidetes bacterium]|nr:enoyl-CoA hydratase/isomerase family protein [Bacteroidota bacterium]MCW5897477.1 enoyl-CoA hydratase/isomerase family protein [Bacteroidota bacterium]